MGNSDRWVEISITELLFFYLFSSLDAGGNISGVANPTFAPTAPIMVQFWQKMKTIKFFLPKLGIFTVFSSNFFLHELEKVRISKHTNSGAKKNILFLAFKPLDFCPNPLSIHLFVPNGKFFGFFPVQKAVY